MSPAVADAHRDPKTPSEVEITLEPRAPVSDPRVGVTDQKVQQAAAASGRLAPPAQPAHRLVTVGDSLTHGFQSLAIFNTDLSYPAIIAWEMGWDQLFRRPQYNGFGGLPLNLEYIIRDLEAKFGDSIGALEMASALFHLRHRMDEIEDWWERGPGQRVPHAYGIMHNLGIYGWDIRDVLSRTAGDCRKAIGHPSDDWVSQIVEDANERAALRVLQPGDKNHKRSTIGSARILGDDGGIETLIMFVGANNALKTVTNLKVCWSTDPEYKDPGEKNHFTVWNPIHFQAELNELGKIVKEIAAGNVIWATVPHVTIAPVARGVCGKLQPGSRYFHYYTRPWITDRDFDKDDDPCITGAEARAVDSAIDQYNDSIAAAVKTAREEGYNWFLLDTCGLLDRMASRRYLEDPSAQPKWWMESGGAYELPDELKALSPVPDTRFFSSGPTGRVQGGLFSLDGTHPTTIGYGILAQEFIKVMQTAGVKFYMGDGRTERAGDVKVDFRRLIAHDTLISQPPRSVSSDLKLIGWIDEKLDLFSRFFPLRNG